MKKSIVLLATAILIVSVLWFLQPKNVLGIRVEAEAVLSKGFPFEAFSPVIQQITADDHSEINYDHLIKDRDMWREKAIEFMKNGSIRNVRIFSFKFLF